MVRTRQGDIGETAAAGLTYLVERKKGGNLITMFKNMTGKDKVEQNLCFTMTTHKGWSNIKKA